MQARTTGRPVAFATPSAKKAPERSSMWDQVGTSSFAARVRTTGVEREPGEVTAPAMPQRASSSTNARSRRWVPTASVIGCVASRSMDDIVLLHGFAGTGHAWDPVREQLDPARYSALTPDLRGHGRRARMRPVSFDGCVRDVLACAPDRPFTLAGYSLGGRVALHVALAAPERLARLVLVATTAGIEHPGEREERRRADAALADRAEGMGRDEFARIWQAQPIFAGTPPEAAAAWSQDLQRTAPRDLAAVLRGIGTGSMAPLWSRLGELRMPCDVVVGERDTKFTALGERLVAALPDARLHVVPGAGHGLPREAPAELAALL